MVLQCTWCPKNTFGIFFCKLYFPIRMILWKMVSDTSWCLKTSPCTRSVRWGWEEMAHPYRASETALPSNDTLGEDAGAITHSRMPDLDTEHSCKNKVTFCSIFNSWIVSINVHNLFVSRSLCWSCFYKQWSNIISGATYEQFKGSSFVRFLLTWPGVVPRLTNKLNTQLWQEVG